MRIKLNELRSALNQINYDLLSIHGEKEEKTTLEISVIEGDPGSGNLVGFVAIKAMTEQEDQEQAFMPKERCLHRYVEIYECGSGMPPIFKKETIRVLHQ